MRKLRQKHGRWLISSEIRVGFLWLYSYNSVPITVPCLESGTRFLGPEHIVYQDKQLCTFPNAKPDRYIFVWFKGLLFCSLLQILFSKCLQLKQDDVHPSIDLTAHCLPASHEWSLEVPWMRSWLLSRIFYFSPLLCWVDYTSQLLGILKWQTHRAMISVIASIILRKTKRT